MSLTGQSGRKLLMAAMMVGSSVAGSGTWPLIRVDTSIRQDPALEIQMAPVTEAWQSSSAVGALSHGGGRTTVNEVDRLRVRLGVFAATSKLPRSTDTASIAIASKLT
jgi:hypothetical protein